MLGGSCRDPPNFDAHFGERRWGVKLGFSEGTPTSSTLLIPASTLFRCLLEQLTESSERLDLERVCVADKAMREGHFDRTPPLKGGGCLSGVCPVSSGHMYQE